MQVTESLNIVLLPDSAAQKMAISLSKKLAQRFPTEFVLNQNDVLPHITLYQTDFPKKNLERIKSTIGKISKQIKPFKIRLSSFSSLSNFLFWNIKKSEKLLALHNRIISELNPLREGYIKKELLNIKNLYPGVQEDVNHYGSLLVGKNYLPHLTITFLKKLEDVKEALKLFHYKAPINFRVQSISLGLSGRFGTVNKLIQYL
ncbi:2'-5' RNA ligase family protein [Candidatus Roizmanbacteria bacterium]|nr:2'-5' RNA ligase family protein [Candidatus Roizmanbacteria bacterium]